MSRKGKQTVRVITLWDLLLPDIQVARWLAYLSTSGDLAATPAGKHSRRAVRQRDAARRTKAATYKLGLVTRGKNGEVDPEAVAWLGRALAALHATPFGFDLPPSLRHQIEKGDDAPGEFRDLDDPAELKRLLIAYVVYQVGRYIESHLLPGQYGGRPAKVIDAVCPRKGATPVDHLTWKLRDLAWDGHFFVLTIDLQDAYGKLPRRAIIEALMEIGFTRTAARWVWQLTQINSLDAKTRKPVKADKKHGIEQGNALSTMLMNLVLAHLLRKTENGVQGRILTYVDDIYVACRTAKEAKAAFKTFRHLARGLGMKNVRRLLGPDEDSTLTANKKASRIIDTRMEPVEVLKTYLVGFTPQGKVMVGMPSEKVVQAQGDIIKKVLPAGGERVSPRVFMKVGNVQTVGTRWLKESGALDIPEIEVVLDHKGNIKQNYIFQPNWAWTGPDSITPSIRKEEIDPGPQGVEQPVGTGSQDALELLDSLDAPQEGPVGQEPDGHVRPQDSFLSLSGASSPHDRLVDSEGSPSPRLQVYISSGEPDQQPSVGDYTRGAMTGTLPVLREGETHEHSPRDRNNHQHQQPENVQASEGEQVVSAGPEPGDSGSSTGGAAGKGSQPASTPPTILLAADEDVVIEAVANRRSMDLGSTRKPEEGVVGAVDLRPLDALAALDLTLGDWFITVNTMLKTVACRRHVEVVLDPRHPLSYLPGLLGNEGDQVWRVVSRRRWERWQVVHLVRRRHREGRRGHLPSTCDGAYVSILRVRRGSRTGQWKVHVHRVGEVRMLRLVVANPSPQGVAEAVAQVAEESQHKSIAIRDGLIIEAAFGDGREEPTPKATPLSNLKRSLRRSHRWTLVDGWWRGTPRAGR